jgi:hypothetical protein
MISYCRVGSNIWDLVVGWGSTARAVAADNCAYLDFQIKQWQDSIPHELKLRTDHESWALSTKGEWLAVSQVLFHMRANQLGILVYKQNLVNTQTIHNNLEGAKTAVDRARDTIQTLDQFSRVSALYTHRPEPFNRFLFSALATLFLAVSHEPNVFTQLCRSDFYKALDTLKRSPTRGKYSRRLQKVLKNLKRINIKPRPNNSETLYRAPSGPKMSSIAEPVLITPSLVAANIDNADYETMPSSLVPEEGFGKNMYSDLTDFFELAGGCFLDSPSNIGSEIPSQEGAVADPTRQAGNSMDIFQAEDETLTRLMVGLL